MMGKWKKSTTRHGGGVPCLERCSHVSEISPCLCLLLSCKLQCQHRPGHRTQIADNGTKKQLFTYNHLCKLLLLGGNSMHFDLKYL